MKRRTKIFWAVSIVIALVDGIFVASNYAFTRAALQETLEQEGQTLRATFETVRDQTFQNMLLIATFVANDPEVQQLFLEGKKAVATEGGGAGGPRAAAARKRLYDMVGPNWKVVQKRFDARQLHFHLGPGSTSYLRVHRPEKFGDNMDNVRFTIVDTNAEKSSRTGFETGRVYSGLRGVVPMSAFDPETGKAVHVGALEVGTSFQNLLGILDQRFDQGVGVMLKMDHILSTMWPDFVKKRFGNGQGKCECAVEAKSRDGLDPIILAGLDAQVKFSATGSKILKAGGIYYAVNHFPLRDYLGGRQAERDDVGAVIFWRDASHQMAAYHEEQLFTALYGLIGYILVEALLFAAFRIVSRRLEAEITTATDALAHSNAELEQFAYAVSHDLQEPLRMVSSYLGMLGKRYSGKLDADADEYIGFAVDGAKRMSNMIRDLLDYSRVHSQGGDFDQVSIRDCLDGALINLKVSMEDSDAQVTIDGGDPLVWGDESQITRVFQNIIGNAIKYRAPDRAPDIRVSFERNGSAWKFQVSDNGIGIDPEYRERVFAIFQRLHSRGEYEGTGIGLAVTKRIIERHGGTIGVDSEPGVGSTFHLTLPEGP